MIRTWLRIVRTLCILMAIGSTGFSQDNSAPISILQITPAPGETISELTSVEVIFSEPVSCGDATHLIVNGQPAVEITSHAPDQFSFTFPEPQTGPVTFEWREDHGIFAEGEPVRSFESGSWTNRLDPSLAYRSVVIS